MTAAPLVYQNCTPSQEEATVDHHPLESVPELLADPFTVDEATPLVMGVLRVADLIDVAGRSGYWRPVIFADLRRAIAPLYELVGRERKRTEESKEAMTTLESPEPNPTHQPEPRSETQWEA